MPFHEIKKMDLVKQMVIQILGGEISQSAATRLYGVSRKTVRKWVRRGLELGVENLQEGSRAPCSRPSQTDEQIELLLLSLKYQIPVWGAKKLVQVMKEDLGVALHVRTADRLLDRNGLVTTRGAAQPMVRFERPESNLLLQMDFKGCPRHMPYSILSVLDDHSRYSGIFKPLKDRTGQSVFDALWTLFGEIGLPERMLMDNGDCWGTSLKRCPTAFEAKLWLLGIMTTHGRPRHPQTQGKVERFHQTAILEIGPELYSQDIQQCARMCEDFRRRYNWVRPHEELGGKVPGLVYKASDRKRPNRMPELIYPEGSLTRKVDDAGAFFYRGQRYRLGKGLVGQRIMLKEDELGLRAYYASFPMRYLTDL
jgi:transposase InsO family protein